MLSLAVAAVFSLIGVVYGLNVKAIDKIEARQECIREKQANQQAELAAMRWLLSEIKEELAEIKKDVKLILSNTPNPQAMENRK